VYVVNKARSGFPVEVNASDVDELESKQKDE